MDAKPPVESLCGFHTSDISRGWNIQNDPHCDGCANAPAKPICIFQRMGLSATCHEPSEAVPVAVDLGSGAPSPKGLESGAARDRIRPNRQELQRKLFELKAAASATADD
jgi:hypothetical protein